MLACFLVSTNQPALTPTGGVRANKHDIVRAIALRANLIFDGLYTDEMWIKEGGREHVDKAHKAHHKAVHQAYGSQGAKA